MSTPIVRIATRLFTPEVGAAAFRQRVLADAFSAMGYRVEVLTTVPPGDAPREDDGLAVDRWPVLRDENGNVRGYLQYLSFDVPLFLRLLTRRRPALLVAEPPPTTGLVVRLVSRLQRAPYVYYAADVWSDAAGAAGAGGPLVALLRRTESWVLRGAVSVLAVSDGVAERVETLGVPRDRIVVTGNGIDTRQFSPDGPDTDHPAPYFVYTGTMSEWQGADVFVRALAQVREQRPDVRLVFLGQGSELPGLKRLATRVAPGAVDFPGVVPPAEAARWLRGATAALVSIKPGLGYDFAKPTKIYAATACGTPVIFAGQGASEELITRKRLGWVAGYETDAVAGAMRAALELPQDKRREQSAHLVAWTSEHASLTAAGSAAARQAADAADLPLR